MLSTGSEVSIAYEGAKQLVKEGIAVRVVSLPSWELFSSQSDAYRAAVIPADVPKLAIEAGTSFGWERWIGNDKTKSDIIAVDRFGASAPYKRVYAEFGLTPENVVKRAKALLGK